MAAANNQIVPTLRERVSQWTREHLEEEYVTLDERFARHKKEVLPLLEEGRKAELLHDSLRKRLADAERDIEELEARYKARHRRSESFPPFRKSLGMRLRRALEALVGALLED